MPERENRPRSSISFLDIELQNEFKNVNPFNIANNVGTNLETLPVVLHELWRTGRTNDIYNVIYVVTHEFGQDPDYRDFGAHMMYTVSKLLEKGDSDKNVTDYVAETLPIWERAYLQIGINQELDHETAEIITRVVKKIIDGGHTLKEIPEWESVKSSRAQTSMWN
jgi:hypothetical protein